MSKDTTNNSQPSVSFKELQGKIEDLREKRDDLNKKTKDYITKLQNVESQINEKLSVAKDQYKKKRDYWNDKVKKLKDKKIEYKDILDKFIDERKKVQKPRNDLKKAQYVDIKQVTRKIDALERRIETENLDIAEENAIVDQIKELAESKHEFLDNQNSEELYKLDRKIEIVKVNLNKIYEQLNKWSNKSQDNHGKMLEIYDSISELKTTKKKMEEELIKNKKAADDYHEQFLELMNQRKKISKNKRPPRTAGSRTKKPKYRSSKDRESEQLKKMKKEKLAVALEKKNAGKKLNLYEARLILEQQSLKDN